MIRRCAENARRTGYVDASEGAGAVDPELRILAALDIEREVSRLPPRKRERIRNQLGRRRVRGGGKFSWVLPVVVFVGLVWFFLKMRPHVLGVGSPTESRP